MQLQHSGIDYQQAISDSEPLLDAAFETRGTEFLLPFNPVVTDLNNPPSIAFFGLNAYCNDLDFLEAKQQQNFMEWCQNNYNPKLLNVMKLWKSGLSSQHQGAIYYTNFVKLVLRENDFTKAEVVKKRLSQHSDCAQLFARLAICEVQQLQAQGCRIFICFGLDVYNLMLPVADATSIQFICERHFSWYYRRNTESLIQRCLGKSERGD